MPSQIKLLFPTSIHLDLTLLAGFSVTLIPYDVTLPTSSHSTPPVSPSDYDAQILLTWTNTGANLSYLHAHLPDLKWIQSLAAGPNDVLNAGFSPSSSLTVTTGSGLHDATVAEHALGLILNAARRFYEMRDYQLQGKWPGHLGGPQPDRPAGLFQSLEGAKVVIWGMGNIGKRLAGYLGMLGAEVRGVARSKGVREGVECFTEGNLVGEEGLLGWADVLVMILPGDASTKDALNGERIKAMQKHAWVVNVGRGTSVDEEALCDALDEGRLGGAALDVFVKEPLPEGNRMYTTKNLILSPHAAGGRPRGAEALVAENLRRFIAGQELKNRID